MKPLFGSHNFDDDDRTMKVTFYASLFLCIYLSQLWKQAKWGEIRNFIKNYDQENKHKEVDKIQNLPQFL
jgi:hypothetical protein